MYTSSLHGGACILFRVYNFSPTDTSADVYTSSLYGSVCTVRPSMTSTSRAVYTFVCIHVHVVLDVVKGSFFHRSD